ncbi:unnamed protein product, partial [Brugia timori]|uniref:PH domain-containing protein n=1 Tax=Brugia timori TaxID=42155 RepID=A0A0R3R4J1_9BILA
TGNIGSSLPAIRQQQQSLIGRDTTSQQVTNPTKLIRRVKHVGRDGWLWIIAEFVELNDTPTQDTARCEICVVEMQTFMWYRLDWLPGCKFDELTLDITRNGTVVMLRKKMLQMANQTQVDSFLLFSRNPEPLLKQSFHDMATNMLTSSEARAAIGKQNEAIFLKSPKIANMHFREKLVEWKIQIKDAEIFVKV